jgi:uncharacterized repeat protein (TIGR01451 family)
MNRYTRVFVIVAIAMIYWCSASYGQIVGANVFLQGNFVEIGMLNNGAFGAPSSPAGYHPNPGASSTSTALAEVYDIGHDGWTVGSPPMMGDFTYPGYPFEGWGLQADGGRTHAFVPGTYIHGGGGSLTGSVTGYLHTAAGTSAYWTGTAAAGQLAVESETRVDANASHVMIKVKLKNTSSAAVPGVYYLRSCDPDIDVALPGGSFSTSNAVVYQNDLANRVLVEARASSSTYPGALMGLGARDSRARAFIYNSTPMSISVNFADIYGMTVPSTSGPYYYGIGTHPGDIGIGLIFNLGTIAAGDSVTFSYAYIFTGSSSFDTVFALPCTGTPFAGFVNANTATACPTTGVALNVTGYSVATGLAFQWQSSPDSITWTDVPTAISTIYSFSGLTATTYYRCMVSCVGSGMTAPSAGLKISYSSICPCVHVPGTTFANVGIACATTAITLNDTSCTSGSGVSYQWQSSTDSVSWSDMAGATTVPYSFSGLGATKFYRLKVTCVATGLALYSNARKINFSSVCSCSGAPTGGVATASLTYCSSCMLDLDLSGATLSPDMAFQWERSTTGTSGWGSISGATTAAYTYVHLSPYYYRCKLTCPTSGLSAYSTSVLVLSPVYIIADSVKKSPDTSCSGQQFYVRAGNSSPLLRLITYFGDGSQATNSLISLSGTSYANVGHTYASPGHYTVKHVLCYDTLAVDSVTFTYEHRYCNLFPLKFYIEQNGNCQKEDSEIYNYTPIIVQVDSNDVPIDTLSVTSGLYFKASGPVGAIYKFTVIPGALVAVCPTSGIILDTILAGVSTYATKYVGLNCSSPSYFDFGEFATVQCGKHLATARILLNNYGCYNDYPSMMMAMSSKYHSSWGTFPFSAVTGLPVVSGNSATWPVTALSATGEAKLFTVIFGTSGISLPIGDTIHSRYLISPIIGDFDTSNNGHDRIDTVKASYDPNIIEVSPSACFDNDTTLQFIVHFENMGNDTAHNVYVLDTISANLDMKSMKILAASDVMNIYSYVAGGYSIVKFDFPDIDLLDSAQHGLNDGMFVYNIKTKPGLSIGSNIFSRVGIYFDDNEVVLTNTVQNTKGCPPTEIRSTYMGSTIAIYPNPVTDELTLETEQGAYTVLTITNAIGQQLIRQGITDGLTKVDVKTLPAGVYTLTVKGAQGSEVRKFVKW